jgi:hypothetical protein
MCADNLSALGFIGDKLVNFRNGTVEDGNLEAVVIHVKNEVLSHNGEADKADIAGWFWHTLSG